MYAMLYVVRKKLMIRQCGLGVESKDTTRRRYRRVYFTNF